jgi:hypothetical protein
MTKLVSSAIVLACVLYSRASPADSWSVAEESGEDVRASAPRARPSSWTKYRWAIDAQVGIATPLGAIGVGVDYTPLLDLLSLDCGIGTNFVGPEIACGLRLRHVFQRGHQSIYLGLGASGGPHEQTRVTRLGAWAPLIAPLTAMGHGAYSAGYRFDIAYWANVEFGYESRSRKGGTFRAFVGSGILLNPGQARSTDPPPSSAATVLPPATALGYVGVAFGRAL